MQVYAPYGDAGRYAQLPEGQADVKYHYQKALPNQRPAWEASTPDLLITSPPTLPRSQPPMQTEANLASDYDESSRAANARVDEFRYHSNQPAASVKYSERIL